MWCLDRVGDGVVQEVGDLHLEDEADERGHQRGDEDPLVGPHDGHGPAEPGQGPVGVDGGPGASLRAASAMGTNSVPCRRGPCDRALSVGRPHRCGAPGQPRGQQGAPPQGQALEGPVGVGVVAQVAGDLEQPGVDGVVGGVEHLAPVVGQDVVHPASVALDGAALDQAPGDQSVDHRGDRRGPDGQPLGQVGGERRAARPACRGPGTGAGRGRPPPGRSRPAWPARPPSGPGCGVRRPAAPPELL